MFVRLIAHRGDFRDDLLVDEIGDLFFERGAVDVERNFRDDELLAVALHLLHADASAQLEAAFAGGEIIFDALDAADEIRRSENPAPLMNFINSGIVMSGLSICAQMPSMTSPRLCGAMFVAMPTAMPVPPLTSRFGKRGGENPRLGETFVVVRDEIHRVLLHVLHQRRAEMRQPRLGVTHRRRRIVFDGTEIALAVHELLAHRPRLRHVHERRINHRFAVRMVVAGGVAADLRALVSACVPGTATSSCIA